MIDTKHSLLHNDKIYLCLYICKKKGVINLKNFHDNIRKFCFLDECILYLQLWSKSCEILFCFSSNVYKRQLYASRSRWRDTLTSSKTVFDWSMWNRPINMLCVPWELFIRYLISFGHQMTHQQTIFLISVFSDKTNSQTHC